LAYEKTYDLFITHAWRYHSEWTEISRLFDDALGQGWRNFSVPWHDPAMDANTETGGKFVRNWLETQIMPVHGVILLSGVYQVKSTQKWLDLELEFARMHDKPVIAVPARKQSDVPKEIAAKADAVCQWDAADIIAAIDRLNNAATA
jgi:hypothetical protein